MRTTTVTIDDQEFKIGDLTLDQAEDILDDQQDIVSKVPLDNKLWRRHIKRVVLVGLKNAGSTEIDALEQCAKNGSVHAFYNVFPELQRRIMELSGMKLPSAKGEAPAPESAPTSEPSVAEL